MEEEFKISDFKPTVDFKDLFFKIIGFWKVYLLFLLVCLGVAYSINLRKKSIFRLGNQIVVSNDQNPFFTANTSLTFNWGGVSDKVQTVITLLQSRSHNEKVVEYLQFYVDYERKAEYWKYDAYKTLPFLVEVDTTHAQLINVPIEIKPISDEEYELSYELGGEEGFVQNYATKKIKRVQVKPGKVVQKVRFNKTVVLPHLRFKLNRLSEEPITDFDPFTIKFMDFNAAVGRFRSISVRPNIKNSPILNLSKVGHNSNRMADYLNASVKVLSRDQLEQKNLFATRTINFVDKMLDSLKNRVDSNEKELNAFRRKTKTLDIGGQGEQLSNELANLDLEQNAIQKRLKYLDNLEQYLLVKKSFKDVPAPSIVGIEEPNIVKNVGEIITLSVERSKLNFGFKENSPVFQELDRNIASLKEVLLENIASYRDIIGMELRSLNRRLAKTEGEFSKLPEEQQRLINIERKYKVSSERYDVFLGKRGEAALIKAANVSDLIVIDEARAREAVLVGPNKDFNYITAVLVAFGLPTAFILLFFLINNKITGLKDIEFLSKISVLGVIGKSKRALVVFERSKSPVTESFRSIRSSLKFIYNKGEGIEGDNRTVLITSSVSGEGKTFLSINLASIYAMSGKKTVLVGLDLRKPKIVGEFEGLHNEFGVVNCLVDNKDYYEVIQKTHIPNLDLISSGPIPPNPSELLISDQMEAFMKRLKEDYDYVILDTPPLGLVTDALDLMRYSDANIYVVRQDYTRKGMLGLINEKYTNGEIKNVSFVLNYFKQKTGYGYNYNYGYGYNYGVYGNGYHEVEKDEGIIKKILKFITKRKK